MQIAIILLNHYFRFDLSTELKFSFDNNGFNIRLWLNWLSELDMGGNPPNPENDPLSVNKFWSFMTRNQAKFAVGAALATIFGVYLNATFNYANLMINRSRQTVDLLRGISEVEVSDDSRSGRSCLKYANLTFNNKAIVDLWTLDTEDFILADLPPSDDHTKTLLAACLANFKAPEQSAFIDEVMGGKQQGVAKNLASAYISRQLFNYLNIYEDVFIPWKDNRADQIRLCEQLDTNVTNETVGSFMRRGGDVLEKENSKITVTKRASTIEYKGKKIVEYYYPGANWYLEGKNNCEPGTGRWFRNYVSPLFPFLSSM